MKTFIQIKLDPLDRWNDVKISEHCFIDRKQATTWALHTAIIMKANIRLCFPESETDTALNMSGIYF